MTNCVPLFRLSAVFGHNKIKIIIAVPLGLKPPIRLWGAPAGTQPSEVMKNTGIVPKRARKDSVEEVQKTGGARVEEPPLKAAPVRRRSIRPKPIVQ